MLSNTTSSAEVYLRQWTPLGAKPKTPPGGPPLGSNNQSSGSGGPGGNPKEEEEEESRQEEDPPMAIHLVAVYNLHHHPQVERHLSNQEEQVNPADIPEH